MKNVEFCRISSEMKVTLVADGHLIGILILLLHEISDVKVTILKFSQ